MTEHNLWKIVDYSNCEQYTYSKESLLEIKNWKMQEITPEGKDIPQHEY